MRLYTMKLDTFPTLTIGDIMECLPEEIEEDIKYICFR